MIKTVSEKIYTVIKAFSDANGSPFGDGEIYPIIAPKDAIYPFLVYQINIEDQYSKQGVFDVNVQLLIVNDGYDAMLDVVDDLQTYLKTDPDMHFLSGSTGINPDDQNEFNISLTYNLKMIQ